MKASRTATIATPGRSETHAVKLINLTRTDRAVLESMARRHRVNKLTHFLEGILATEDQKANPDSVVVFSL
jgi:uncharacterized protein YfdQ (DUF2303 family)